MYRLGIDLGGTKTEGIVLDPKLTEVFRKRIATEQEGGYDHILKNIQQLYKDLKDEIKNEPHTLGLGTPGALSKKTGLLKNSNTLCLNEKPFQQDLERQMKRKFAIQNDANCFALAEALKGAAQGKDLVFGVIMGTGCGGGIVYQGKVIEGKQSIAGEWGHVAIDPHGPLCYCGSRGCIETFISGGGLERFYEHQYHDRKSFQAIIQDYRRFDDRAMRVMKAFFANFGRAMANLINVLDPDIVVLGGGVSNIGELYTEGVAQISKMVFIFLKDIWINQ